MGPPFAKVEGEVAAPPARSPLFPPALCSVPCVCPRAALPLPCFALRV